MLRELRAEGYQILLARNSMEIFKMDDEQSPVDLLILDVGIPDFERESFTGWFKNRAPSLPLIVHSFTSDYEAYAEDLGPVTFIEKNENSIEQLKKVVASLSK
jgi:DNA-binding NtrC family response regulator